MRSLSTLILGSAMMMMMIVTEAEAKPATYLVETADEGDYFRKKKVMFHIHESFSVVVNLMYRHKYNPQKYH